MLVKDDHPVLHNPNKEVDDSYFENDSIKLKSIAALLADKIDTSDAYGVSACQLGIDLAMFMTCIDGEKKLVINPQIVAASVEMDVGLEGCLSYPGLFLKVRRPTGIFVRYKDINNTEITERLDDLPARVWLHEYDHTNGICFVDRVGKLALNMAKKRKIKKLKRRTK
jgi:peptide deformylase